MEKIVYEQQGQLEQHGIEPTEYLEHLWYAMKKRKGARKMEARMVLSPVKEVLGKMQVGYNKVKRC
jgi:hypothetical protein